MTAYDREMLVTVLVHHWRDGIKGCGCGWDELGKSHPEHVADVYEQMLAAGWPEPVVVRRDQCFGRTLACANCGVHEGGKHNVLCHAYAKARRDAERRAART